MCQTRAWVCVCMPTTDVGFVRLFTATAAGGEQRRRLLPTDYDDEDDELFDPRVPSWLERHRHDNEQLMVVPTRIVAADVHLDSAEPLGFGRQSAALMCVVHRCRCVVKVPKLVLQLMPLPEQRELPSTADVLTTVDPSDVDRLFNNYAREAHYVRRLLDPAGTPDHGTNGDAAVALTRAQVLALFDEHDAMRRHPGFSNIHRVLHIELNRANPFPMLFSQFCDGTLERLVHHDPCLFESTDHPHWRAAATQIVHGFDYMRTRGVVHGDLCVRNVFFQLPPDRRIDGTRYVISDFENAHSWPQQAGGAWPHMAGRGLEDLGSTLAGCFLDQLGARIREPVRDALSTIDGQQGRYEPEAAYRALRAALGLPIV